MSMEEQNTVESANTIVKKSHYFQPGNNANPLGRPKGTKHKIASAFLTDYLVLWNEGGMDALRRVMEKRPAEFCRIAANLIPKEFFIREGKGIGEMSSEEIDAFLEQLQGALAGNAAKVIEPDPADATAPIVEQVEKT